MSAPGARRARIFTTREMEGHKRNVTLGTATILPNGRVLCTLDTIPLWKDWDGSFVIDEVVDVTKEEKR